MRDNLKNIFDDELTIKGSKFDVCVNPATECLGVMFVLSDFPLNKARSNKEFLQEIGVRFANWKSHPAVKLLKTLLQSEFFRYNGPVEMFLNIYYGKPINQAFCQRFGLDFEIVKEFLKELKNFVSESDFNNFYKSKKSLFVSKASRFLKDINAYSPVQYLENFLNMKVKNLKVLLMFGVSTANYGIQVKNLAICCVRPYKTSRFKGVDFAVDKPYITTLLLHEFAHTVINPMTANYHERVAKMDSEKFERVFENNPYGGDKQTAINECVIRAIECLYVKEIFPKDFESFLKDYENDGFLSIRDLMKLYEKYIAEKKQYSDFKSFYPNVIEYFSNK